MLYEKLRENHDEVHGDAEEVPLPVTEVASGISEVVRCPAFNDGQFLWQGATFYRHGDNCSVYFDDGRRFVGDLQACIKFWNANGAEWAETKAPEGAI